MDFLFLSHIPVSFSTPGNLLKPLVIHKNQPGVLFPNGFELVGKYKLVVDKVENNVIKDALEWCVPITRKEVHLILARGLSPVLYPGPKLESLTTISFTSPTMLLPLIQSEIGEHTDQNCFEMIYKITQS